MGNISILSATKKFSGSMDVMKKLTLYCRKSHIPSGFGGEKGSDVHLLVLRKCLWFLFVVVQSASFLFFLSAPAKAGTEKMNISPNSSFEDDLTDIKTNVCVFGGWFPIGIVTEDGVSEIKIVNDNARTGKRCLQVKPNSKTLNGTIYYSQYNGGEEVRSNITSRGIKGARTIALRLDQDIDEGQ